MSALRSLHLLEFPTLSGGERSLLSALSAAGEALAPLLLAPPQGDVAEAARAAGLPLRPFELRSDGRRRPFEEVAEALAGVWEEEGAQALHANSLSAGEYSGLAGELAGGPAVAHVRDIQKLNGARRGRLGRNAAILCVSQATADSLASQGLPAERLRVLFNGIAPGWAEGVAPARLWEGDDGRAPVLLNVGQLCLRKAQDLLLEALLPLLAERPALRLAIAGRRFSQKAESVAYEAGLRRAVAEAGLEARVLFLGERGDVAALMRRATLLVHSAHQEPLGRVLLESLGAGLPAVATEVGGTAEVFEDGVSGWLVPPRDAAALRGATRAALDDEAGRARIAAAARARGRARFSPEAAGAGLVAALREAMAAQGSSSS